MQDTETARAPHRHAFNEQGQRGQPHGRTPRGQCRQHRNSHQQLFEKTNVGIFQHLTKAAADHPALTIATARTPAKVALFQFGKNDRLTIETSANLRSSQNIEQITAIADPALYAFHRQWLDELFQ